MEVHIYASPQFSWFFLMWVLIRRVSTSWQTHPNFGSGWGREGGREGRAPCLPHHWLRQIIIVNTAWYYTLVDIFLSLIKHFSSTVSPEYHWHAHTDQSFTAAHTYPSLGVCVPQLFPLISLTCQDTKDYSVFFYIRFFTFVYKYIYLYCTELAFIIMHHCFLCITLF